MNEMSIEDAQRYMLGALRRDLSVFTQKSFRYLEPGVNYMHNWHIDAISEYLMACHNGDIKRLIVNIPPRYMKSLSITVAYPAWALGNDPAKRFLCASYSSNISKKLSIDCRTLVESRWFQMAFPEFRLRHDQNTKERFMTDKQGMRMATSITGSATGDGADCLAEGTLVTTPCGDIPIEIIHKNQTNKKVYSYNHLLDTVQISDIIATKEIYRSDYLDVYFSNGTTIRCTPEHPIYIKDAGYIKAESVCVGNTVCYLGGESNQIQPFVCKLWFGASKAVIRIKKGAEAKINRLLLLSKMQEPTPRSKKQKKQVQNMRVFNSKEGCEILLDRLQGHSRQQKKGEEKTCFLSEVWNFLRAKIKNGCLLFKTLPEHSARKEVDWSQEGGFPQARRADGYVQETEKTDNKKGWWALRCLCRASETSRSSHRRECLQQHSGKPYYDVHELSQNTPRQKYATITRIDRNNGEKQKFYDIQVETTNNFYANGVLVHNCLIADDPLNPKQAGSEVERRRVNEWFDQTFTSRLNNKREGVIIVVQQRLHPDDLTGHLLEKGGWEHLNIPAIAPERTTITFGNFERVREEGEVLHEAREDKEMLDRMRRDMGTHVFQSQYQQNPRGTEGAMVNLAWFPRYEKTSPDTQSIVLSWDFAQKVGQENDFTACTVWGVTPNNYQLLHVYNRKLTFGQAREFVKLMDERWEPQVHLMEDKSAGTAIIQDLKETTTIPIVPMLPGANDKASRLLAVVGTMEAGVVELPKDADWLLKFEEQLCDFPNVKHDDMVDTMTQFLRWAIRKNRKLRDLPAPVCVGGGVDTVLLI